MSLTVTNPVSIAINDLKTRLQSIAKVKNVVMVYSDKDLMNVLKGIQDLSVGVVYEGMRPRDGSGQSSHKMGLSVDLSVAFLVMTPQLILGQQVPKDYSLEVLESIRNKMRDTTSTTAHTWRFLGEAPAMEKEGCVIWAQRWSTPAQLTQGME